MDLYFAGGEVPSHRNLLSAAGAQHIALSYMGLRRRVKFSRPWLIEDKFTDQDIFLDSGAYTVNKEPEKFTQGDLKDIAAHYREFVTENIDRVTMVSEFDALALGKAWIEQERADFYDSLPAEKFMPIWHDEWGLDELDRLAREYERVGVHATSLGGRDLAPFLNNLVSSTQVHLHGMAMTKIDQMETINWASVASTSWLSPQAYGDTIVWTGREMKRYPKKYKDQARKRYRGLFEREGFDSEKIENDDSTELLRLSVWSWQHLMTDIDRKHRRPRLVTVPPPEDGDDFAEIEGEEVDIPDPETRNSLTTVRETQPLPVIGVNTRTEKYRDDSGQEQEREITGLVVRSDSTRKCASCFLASKCPAYDVHSTCAYNIPIQMKTRDQFIALQNSLIEMQAQRVLFMRYAEETEGGYADPNLSNEMDRLQKMLKAKHEMESEGFTFKMEAKARGATGQSGMIARLFGDQASQTARALPEPVNTDDVLEGIVEPNWVDV